MRVLYRLLYPLALLVAGPWLLATRGRHYLGTLKGRFTLERPRLRSRPLWIHAVSVGESMVAATLAGALPDRLPLLVTTVTPTGQRRARSLLEDRATIAYLPLDLGVTVKRFLDRARPRGLVLVEGDYWPRLLEESRNRDIPVVAVNARVGDRTFSRLRRARPLARWLLGPVERFGAQSELDRRRLEGLGVDPKAIRVTGNLKYEAPLPPRSEGLEALLGELAGGRPLLVAGSTMEGEEDDVLAAFQALESDALLILAPRHPERWDDVAGTIEASGCSFVRRSRPEEKGSGRPEIVLLDSLGELADVYRYAAAAFVGGTLVGTGGHNPLEPARFGTPVAVGPSMENFRDMARQFDRRSAWVRVRDARDLAAIWDRWLAEPAAARERGEKGRKLVEENQGSLQRTLGLLEPWL